MVSLRNVASSVSYYVANELNIDEKGAQTIRYGLEIIIGIILQGIILTIVSYSLGTIPYVFMALVTFSSLRLISGGVHFTTFARCTVFSTSIAMGLGYFAIVLGYSLTKTILILAIILASSVGLYFVKKWAPADTSCKPILREDKRQKFRRASKFYILAWAMALIALSLIMQPTPVITSLALASIGGFALQVVSLCPACYNFIAYTDSLLDRLLL